MPIYSEALEQYYRETFAAEDEALKAIRAGIAERGLPTITVKPEEGRFLQFLAAISGARLALEIGTLGGYSGTWIARGLAPGGRLITLEREPDRAAVAREHFALASVAERVEIRVGDAHELLPRLAAQGPFDFVFIDAEKEGYPAYLEWSLRNLRPGGVVAGHNAFGHGDVIDPSDTSERTRALREFNLTVAHDPRLVSVLYPAGDGMAAAVLRR